MKLDEIFSVKGKVAFVTGGSRGIGEMIASAYLANGAKVYISARKADACDAKAIELSEKYSAECISIPGDGSTMEGIEKLVEELTAYESKLDILVNNAGASWGEPIDEFAEKGWDKVMNINVKGLFYMTQKCLPLLRPAGTRENPARVINIGSIDGIGTPVYESYVYSSSKAAVHQLTRVLANRLAERNININAIAPGPFQSQMMNETLKKYEKEIINSVPRKRIGVPEDMAGAAIFLSSKASAYITGIVLPVDGGSLIARRHMV